ncbi:hypothetical protein MSAN_01969300 [Mycena sanguinolenta]|uniref:DUF6533 domain-containing protein n=1 Tax=Mycena sanguinolenta TaxID=230812 RepID=A0A8H6XP94_9AGAR|nr:hypothetical protein MSAN_01969300 [Mycena sanguinolenta]
MSDPLEDSAVVWANRALISAAAIFLYDFALTFTKEVELYRHSGRERKLLWSFLALRYLPALYQLLMVLAVIFFSNPTYRVCSITQNTSFQFSYVGIISWRVKVINGNLFAIPLALMGLSPGIINVVVSSPSSFPHCRLLNTTPPARIITILPCLRAAFDAATTLALFTRLLRHVASMGALASHTVSFVLTEETKDIALILAIMTMEAVFAQIPSARNHARNFGRSIRRFAYRDIIHQVHARARGEKQKSWTVQESRHLRSGTAPACHNSNTGRIRCTTSNMRRVCIQPSYV